MREELLAQHIAEVSFEGKTDLAGRPYIEHIKRVAGKFSSLPTICSVALLHDLLEDCPEWNQNSLRVFFSKQIVDAVVALTKKKGQSYNDYIMQVKANSLAKEVKIADLRDNMDITRFERELTAKDMMRLKKYHAAYMKLNDRSEY